MVARLCHLHAHDALLLHHHSFTISKILYIYTLQIGSCYQSLHPVTFDQELQSILSEMLNISLSSDLVLVQATLPVGFGGIGICSVVQLHPLPVWLLLLALLLSSLRFCCMEMLYKTLYRAPEDALPCGLMAIIILNHYLW